MRRNRAYAWRKWAFFGAAIAICLATLFPLAIARHTHTPLPYHDSFSSNSAREWQAFGGVWQLSGGTIFNRSDERGAKLITGSRNWSNYRMQADLQMIGNGGDIGIIVRAGRLERGIDSYNGYYIGLRSLDSSVVIGRADYGWLEGHPVPMPGGVQTSVWYRLVVVAVGCRIAATATNMSTGQMAWAAFEENPCVRRGKIGLRSMATRGAWRNISVRRATFQDWEAIRTHAAFVQHPIYPIREADYNRMRDIDLAQSHGAEQDNHRATMLLSNNHSKAGSSQAPELVPIQSLKTTIWPAQPLRIRGVVTLIDPLFIQDSTGGIAVDVRKPVRLNLGDEVEVTGTQANSGYAPRFEASAIRLLWDRTLVVPLSISSTQAASGAFNSSLVEVRGYLRSKSVTPDGTITLNISDTSQFFIAISKSALSLRDYKSWEPGSLLRVDGVCVLGEPFATDGSAFALLTRSTDDIQVISGPPWWSGERVLRLIIPLVLLVILGIALYIRIERWKMRGILDERERLAHEMHDTLAQSFAGVGFHLQGIRNTLRSGNSAGPADLMEKLDLACDLVTQTHREASASIAALHPDADEGRDLLVALEHYAMRMFNAGDLGIMVARQGTPRDLSLPVRDALFQIGREAITNVIRHSHGSQIALGLRYELKWLVLTVQDNGIGFVPAEMSGFGIKSMLSRCNAIRAELSITSTPGAGTTVSVRSPYGLRLTFMDWIRHAWKRQQSELSNARAAGD